MESKKYSKGLILWLFIGLLMIFVQVIVGGITRLTGSGLSITKWEVVTGTLPPLNERAWMEAFELYKDTPQYKEINEGMSMDDFKFIYFWEYIHRFWARIMGFVFLIPFLYFYFKGKIDNFLLRHLFLVIVLATLAATFGWIMVASGLIERPWVNAYKLSLHLLIAFAVFAALLWTFLGTIRYRFEGIGLNVKKYVSVWWVIFGIFIFQLFLGGVLSGMKAAVVYPTWPDMNGQYFPSVLFDWSQWNAGNFNQYDKNIFMPSLIHFLHRNTAYILFFSLVLFGIKLFNLGKSSNNNTMKYASFSLVGLVSLQALIGIVTVMNSQGQIPILWASLHQAIALLLLASFVFTIFILKIK